jgi:hypothetical protein
MLNNIAALMGGGTAAVGDYESISTTTLGSATASVTFSSIPATYTHLQIRAIHRNSTAATSDNWAIAEFNSDTTAANYYAHNLYGSGANPAGAGSSASNLYFTSLNNNNTASAFGATVIDILDYANTNKYKTSRVLNGWDANGSGFIYLNSGLWKNTAAISSITLKANTNNFVTYSSFALYGIK